MTKGTKTITILIGSILLIIFGVRIFENSILNRFSPPEIIVTRNKISNSEGFMQPVTIERLKVDSFGKDKRPTKYIIEYLTTCTIKQKDREPPVSLNEVKLNEPGRYSWSEENVRISIVHPDGPSNRIDSAQRSIMSTGHQNFSICPLKFEKENWYFINFQDPVFIGVYVNIDKTDSLHQYAVYGKKLPI